MNLTPKQKNKLLAASDIIEKGDIAVLEKLLEFQDFIEEKENEVSALTTKVTKEIDDYKTGLLEEIKKEIPNMKGPKGDQGDNYTLTDTDKSDIAQKVKVPIVDRIIEKTETIVKEPIFTENKVTIENPVSAEQIRDKLETLTEDDRLDKSAIKGLDEEFKKVEEKISKAGTRVIGGARASHATKLYPLTADGTTVTFSVPKSISGVVFSSDFPTILMENNGFTINKTRTQIVLTTPVPPSSDSQLLYMYQELFNT